MSAKKILPHLPDSSTETDPMADGYLLLEPYPGSAPADKGPFEPLKEAS